MRLLLTNEKLAVVKYFPLITATQASVLIRGYEKLSSLSARYYYGEDRKGSMRAQKDDLKKSHTEAAKKREGSIHISLGLKL